MAKVIYRLDLTQEELDSIKDKLEDNLLNKIKKIEISDKKINSTKKAVSQKVEVARIKFMQAMADLNDEGIEPTQYNLRKYRQIPYQTSKKYFDMLDVAREEDKVDLDLLPDEDENLITTTLEDVREEQAYNNNIVKKHSRKK